LFVSGTGVHHGTIGLTSALSGNVRKKYSPVAATARPQPLVVTAARYAAPVRRYKLQPIAEMGTFERRFR
jgi:hypothetical protein